MTAIECQCCKEPMDQNGSYQDRVLGDICNDCRKGAWDGIEVLARQNVTGIYDGPCGDNINGAYPQ